METRKTVTLKQVADRAGVSISTVYRVINSPDSLSAGIRDKVERAFKDLNYRNPKAYRAKRKLIAFIVPDCQSPFFSQLTKGIVSVAEINDIDVLIYDSGDDTKNEAACLKKAMGVPVDGIILLPATETRRLADDLVEKHVPLVVIDQLVEANENYSGIYVDNVEGASQAVRYLLSLGHRRIVHLTSFLSGSTELDRIRGYKKALATHGIPLREELIVRGSYQFEDLCAAMETFVKRGVKFTAVFAFNDFMALAAMHVLRKRNLRVPEDVSVVGYDDVSFAAALGLTTVSQPILNMGLNAMRMMMDLVQKKATCPNRIVYTPSMVIRETCRPFSSEQQVGGPKALPRAGQDG